MAVTVQVTSDYVTSESAAADYDAPLVTSMLSTELELEYSS